MNRANAGMSVAVVVAIAVAGLAVPEAWGQACLDAKLVSDDLAERDNFGWSVSISGDVAVVGTNTSGTGTNPDSVYVLRRGVTGWAQEAKLTVPPGFEGVDFGRSVAVGGDVVVVGASGDRSVDQGVAFVYRYEHSSGQWLAETVLVETDAAAGGPAWPYGFAVGVSPSADFIVVASGESSRTGETISPVYVYRPGLGVEPWGLEAKLLIARPGSIFLWSPINWLSTADGQFIGGYPGNLDGVLGGEARIHRVDSATGQWVEEAILTSPDGTTDSLFGLGVAVHGDVAAVIEPDDATGFGAVHVYRRGSDATWRHEAALRGDESRHLFSDVAVQKNVIFASGTRVAADGENHSVVFIYRFDDGSWTLDDHAAGDGLATDGSPIGRSIDSDSTQLIIASRWDSEAVNSGGAAFVFGGVDETDCNRNGIPDACDILDSDSIDANGNGVPDECDPPTCQGFEATIYVDQFGIIVGGPMDGRPYRGMLLGTPGDDVIAGTNDGDLIIGLSGDDVICAGAGDDLINANQGDDTIDAGPGRDRVHGGGGADTCTNAEKVAGCEG